jgi:predicted DNA-binding transcriptional regulator AlpA
MAEQINLGGLKEVSEYLGISRQRVTELIYNGVFPKPIALLACGSIWNMADIEEYKKTRKTKSGPVSKRALNG